MMCTNANNLPLALFNTLYILMITFYKESVFALWFWFEKVGFAHSRILQLVNQALDSAAAFRFGEHSWRQDFYSSPPGLFHLRFL